MNIKTAQNAGCNIRDYLHPGCVVCSSTNSKGLHLSFDLDDGRVESTFRCEECFEGYPGMMHGGVISSILDGAMGNCMFAHGKATVTAEMNIKFRHPVKIGQEAVVSARITRVSHPLYLLEAKIVQDGKVKATARGKYYDQPKLVDER